MKKSPSAAAVLCCALAASLFTASGCHVSFSNGSFGLDETGLDLGEKAVREETHELAIAGAQKLRVEIPCGDVRVSTATSGAPTLHAKITSYGSTPEQARQVVDAARLTIESTSDGVVVHTDDTPATQEIEGGTRRIASRFDLDVHLPPGVQLAISTKSGAIKAVGPFASSELRTNYGSIEVSDVQGGLVVRSASGAIAAKTVRGERVEAVTNYGSVRLSDCDVKTALAKSSSGNVRLEDVKAGEIEAHSSYGDAELERVQGDVEVKLSSGSVRAEDLSGQHHSLKSNYGNLSVARAKGEMVAVTSSGSIKISDFDGRLEARSGYGSVNAQGVFLGLSAESSSGAVDVRALRGSRVESEWKLRSSYGAVKLGVPADIACDFSAKTGYGVIDVDLPIEVGAGELKPGKSVRGKIHGGGELVSLQSSSGNVKLYPLE